VVRWVVVWHGCRGSPRGIRKDMGFEWWLYWIAAMWHVVKAVVASMKP